MVSKRWQMLLLLLTTVGIFLVINHMFLLQRFTGIFLLENSYLYILLASFFSPVFILFRATKGSPRARVPWYDVVLFLVNIGVNVFFARNGSSILLSSYAFFAPATFTVAAIVLWLLVLEGVRRTGGMALFTIVLIFSLYPLFAGYVPGVLSGFNLSFLETARYHALSIQSIIGLPLGVVGTMLMGYLIMGMALVATGGGSFFINLAYALLGTARGGPAKASIIASAFFGSLSGSVTANVIATGTVTIPAMKRAGYPAQYAAGIEACASTGGTLMPPVMGTTAFLMASFLGIPYLNVVVAAIIPSVLYYLGLFLQADAYAARHGMKGLPPEELPSVRRTLKGGWVYLASGAVLIWFLFLRQELIAPFYATAVLFALANVRRETRLSFVKLRGMMVSMGQLLAELVGVLAAVGLIVGALSVTGMAPTLAGDLVLIAGGNVALLLVMGAVASFILGMGLTIIAVYVLLVVVLAPALVTIGLNPLAVHLFIMYWGMVSFITPPVAIGAYVAASIAQAPPMRTGFESMRLGAVMYFIPFLFVINPMLVLQEVTWAGLATALITAVASVFLLACGLQGHIIGIGRLKDGTVGWLMRLLLVAGGFMIGLPVTWTTVVGLILAVPVVLGCFIINRRVVSL